MTDLQGRRFVVTGAGGGIGRATALLAASRGASVLCTDVGAAAVAETAAIVRAAHPEVNVAGEVLDCTDYDSALELISRYAASWSAPFNGLVNVAGINMAKPLADTDLSDLERIFRVNAGGVLVMTRAILGHIVDEGVIVNVSSSSARVVMPGSGAYGASKAANEYLTRTFAVELAYRGIRVCGVGPGAVDTAMPRNMMPPGEEGEKMLAAGVAQMQLIGRLAEPLEIAKSIGYLLSDDASFITGTTLWIDGGTL